MRAAAEYIESNRRPDEPVIAAASGLYFPAIYYFRDRLPCRLYSGGKPMGHYQGDPILMDGDLILNEQLGEISAGRVWVLCRTSKSVVIPIPPHWRLKRDTVFLETIRRARKFRVQMYELSALQTAPPTITPGN